MKRWPAFVLFASSLLTATPARAMPDVLVVEVSEADAAAADRLLELIARPVQRVRLQVARDPASAFEALRSSGAQSMVVLDAELQRVQVLRLGDPSVLTRSVEPRPDAGAPYVIAFVAYELLGLSAELDRHAVAREESGKLRSARAEIDLLFRLGPELLSLGEPFLAALRPTAGAGVGLATAPASRFSLIFLLEGAAFGRATVATRGGRLELTRSDAAIRAGLAYALGRRISLAGFLRPRAASTYAEYSGAGGTAVHRVRFGFGVGLELDLELTPWLALFASPALDVATGRSEYRAQGIAVARDPARLFALSLGLAFIERFQ